MDFENHTRMPSSGGQMVPRCRSVSFSVPTPYNNIIPARAVAGNHHRASPPHGPLAASKPWVTKWSQTKLFSRAGPEDAFRAVSTARWYLPAQRAPSHAHTRLVLEAGLWPAALVCQASLASSLEAQGPPGGRRLQRKRRFHPFVLRSDGLCAYWVLFIVFVC